MNSTLTARKPLKTMVHDLMNELNGDINFSAKNLLSHNMASSRETKANPTISLFKKDYLVGRSLSNEKKPAESAFLNRAVNTVKSTDFTIDILKRLNKRQESLYLQTEYDVKHCSDQIEQKKKQIISLLNSGNFSQHAKYIRQQRQNSTNDTKGKSKVLISLLSLQKRLNSKNYISK